MRRGSYLNETAEGGIFDCQYDEFFTLINADDNLFDFIGYSREEFAEQFDNHILDVIHEGDREALLEELDRQLSANHVFMYENRLVVKGGQSRWIWVSAELVKEKNRDEVIHCIFHDISREKKAQEKLSVSEKRYDIILSHIQDIIFELDCRTNSIYYSPNFERKFGYKIPEENFPDSMFAGDIVFEDDKPILRQRFQSLLKGESEMECEYRIKSASGVYIWLEVHATALRDRDGRLLKILGIISDIDQRKREILRAQKEAVSDPLTGLLNRRECIFQIQDYMSQSRDAAAFMLIDVDNFKKINDTYGHLYGDSLLNEFANRLSGIFRQNDIIARLGGDEFVVFMVHLKSKRAVEEKAARIENVFKKIVIAEETEEISCSIGISFYPGHGSDFRSLFAKADAAMYQVKQGGKGWYSIYGEGMNRTSLADVTAPSRIMKKKFHDHIIEQAFRIFLENKKCSAAIPVLMDLIGRVFQADQIFVYEKRKRTANTYKWYSERISGDAAEPDIDKVSLPDRLCVYLNTDEIEDSSLRQWFADHGAKAAITCVMREKDDISTVIIYEDCHTARVDSDEESYTLLMISQIIHLFLVKEYTVIQFQKQKDEKEKQLLENELAHQEMIYRTALKETHINVWEYDMKERTLRLTDSAEEHHGFRYLENVPQSLLDKGYIHRRSEQDLLDMYRKLEEGEPHVQADILTRSADGQSWWWERIHYTLLFSESRGAYCAVAVGEDVTQQKKAEIIYQQQLQLRLAFDGRMVASFRCNLDKNCVEYVEGQSQKNFPTGMTYEQLMDIHNQYMVNEEDILRLKTLMHRKALLQAYQEGRTVLNFEYRRKDDNGVLYWVNATGHLLRDAQSGDLYIYGTMEDINEKKNLEIALKHRANYDTLTNTYNKDTAVQLIEDALDKARKKRHFYCLLIFNTDYFSDLVRNSGYVAADHVLKELAGQLQMRFNQDKIIGRFYGDEFVVFLYNNPKTDMVWRSAQEVINAMALPYMFPEIKMPINISCGVVFDNCKETKFEALYQKARSALDVAKVSLEEKIVIYNEHSPDILERNSLKKNPYADSENLNVYDSRGENMILKCVFSLVGATDLRPPLENTLKELAAYYDGDRAYVIELDSERKEVKDIYEWKKEEFISIRNAKNQLLKPNVLEKLDTGKLKDFRHIKDISHIKTHLPDIYPTLRNLGISSCFFEGINEGGHAIGYIGIDNPGKNIEDTSVLIAIRYFLSNELIKRCLQEKQEFLSYHDELTGVLNRNSYKEYCANLREEGLISLGIVSVDINGLKKINQNHGNAYGDNILQVIAHIMETEYPSARVYRFTGDEFLLICENISLESFHIRLEQMKNRIEDVCDASVGSAWSDIDISLDRLISSADEKRQIAKQGYYNEGMNSKSQNNSRVRRDVLDEIARNHFTIYLQPKIDARSGECCGAEALVRYLDKRRGVISPGKFVPYLENIGLIRYIDFFVFEEVCKTIKRWTEEGIRLIPISLNFSRATLLEENLIGEMEDIVEKYGVDRNFIEIEITESLGEMERNTVIQISNQILQAGYHIALDDFGAKYSNLSFLSVLHFRSVKLDKSLVNNLPVNPNARTIVKNIVALCRELEMEVYAEGVETEEQVEILQQLRCYYIQGYYYSKPLTCEEFDKHYSVSLNGGK